jgi:predicted SnoaL-like aldol condensation-catalyzing enzyme
MSDIERNKQIVLDFYQTAFSGNPEKAVTDHADPEYTQHNPVVQDGPDGVISFVTSLRGQYPNLRLDIKRVIAEGDMVVTHSHLDLDPDDPDNLGLALADYFRLDQAGKVVEHWDVIQQMPKATANGNGMF